MQSIHIWRSPHEASMPRPSRARMLTFHRLSRLAPHEERPADSLTPGTDYSQRTMRRTNYNVDQQVSWRQR